MLAQAIRRGGRDRPPRSAVPQEPPAERAARPERGKPEPHRVADPAIGRGLTRLQA